VLEEEVVAVDPPQIAVSPGSAMPTTGEVMNYTVYEASGIVNSLTAVP
jgi:hypothetical protein